MTDWKGKRVTVVGLGKSGKAMVSWLRPRGARVRVSDSRPAAEFAEWLGAQGGGLDAAEFGDNSASLIASSDCVVASPGVPLTSPAITEARSRGIPVVGDLEVALEDCPATVVAVTGTNGKTTTTALIGHIVKSAGRECVVAGNIGVPVGQVADGLTERHVLVLEVSSFQLDTSPSFRPRVALLLNVTPDHLDRYADYDAYARSKAGIFARQGAGDLAILNRRDERCARLGGSLKSRVQWFDSAGAGDDGAGVQDGWMVALEGGKAERILRVSDLPIPGAHNLENALAGMLGARAVGVPGPALAAGLGSFPGVPHRLEPAGRIGKVEFVNDSKGTNVDATEKALLSFARPVVLIAGGRDKGADFTRLAGLMRERVRAAILIGEAADKMEAAWKGAVPLHRAGGMEEAVRRGLELAAPEGTVLLSPACASFDQFRNFEHRGEAFKEAVRLLGGAK